MISAVSNSAIIVTTSTGLVPAVVTAATNLAKCVVLKPFARAISTAVRKAILAVVAATRPIDKWLAKVVQVPVGFLSRFLRLGSIGAFARDLLGRLT